VALRALKRSRFDESHFDQPEVIPDLEVWIVENSKGLSFECYNERVK